MIFMTTETKLHPAANPQSIAKRKATMLERRLAKQARRGYPMPLILKCVVTGKEVRYTVPKYIEKVIAKAGSLDNLYKTFTSREGRRIKRTSSNTDASEVSDVPQDPDAS